MPAWRHRYGWVGSRGVKGGWMMTWSSCTYARRPLVPAWHHRYSLPCTACTAHTQACTACPMRCRTVLPVLPTPRHTACTACPSELLHCTAMYGL